jgi:hypothetical protein
LNSYLFFYTPRRGLTQIFGDRFPRLRDVAFDPIGLKWVVAGNNGTILTVEEEDVGIARVVRTSTNQNLRGVDVSSRDGMVLAVGNEGTILLLDSSQRESKVFNLKAPSIGKNLRRVRWSPKGETALAVGNDGAIVSIGSSCDRVAEIPSNQTNHFRGLAWERSGSRAVIIGNNFASGFLPASSLLLYNDESRSLKSLKEANGTELVCLCEKPNSGSVTICGYQLVFFTGSLFEFDWEKEALVQLTSSGEHEFVPVDIDWSRDASKALIASGRLREGTNSLHEFDGKTLTQVAKLGYVPVKVCWNDLGEKALVVASTRFSVFSE